MFEYFYQEVEHSTKCRLLLPNLRWKNEGGVHFYWKTMLSNRFIPENMKKDILIPCHKTFTFYHHQVIFFVNIIEKESENGLWIEIEYDKNIYIEKSDIQSLAKKIEMYIVNLPMEKDPEIKEYPDYQIDKDLSDW